MRPCTVCRKPIVLVPTAAERAAKDVSGRPAAYYTALFTTHADCALRMRTAAALTDAPK